MGSKLFVCHVHSIRIFILYLFIQYSTSFSYGITSGCIGFTSLSDENTWTFVRNETESSNVNIRIVCDQAGNDEDLCNMDFLIPDQVICEIDTDLKKEKLRSLNVMDVLALWECRSSGRNSLIQQVSMVCLEEVTKLHACKVSIADNCYVLYDPVNSLHNMIILTVLGDAFILVIVCISLYIWIRRLESKPKSKITKFISRKSGSHTA